MLISGLIPISVAMIIGGALASEQYIMYTGIAVFPISIILTALMYRYRECIRENIYDHFGESNSPLYLAIYGCVASVLAMMGGISCMLYGTSYDYVLSIYLGAALSITATIFVGNMLYYYYYWRHPPPSDDF